MLTIIRSPRRLRRFSVYDLEWIPGLMQLRVCGVYDAKRGYRCYKTIEAFLDKELTHQSRGRWFYAHFGGMADSIFVLDAMLTRRGYMVTASFSGSSAIIIQVKRGKDSWWFIDSFWLFRDKLANIAKSVGMAKGGPDDPDPELSEKAYQNALDERREWYATCPILDLIRYNEMDCLILWTAIDRFENELLQWGGQLQKTIASCALQLFRRRFLKHEIDTSDEVNEDARKSYFSSRVEVFEREAEDFNYFDINSSFPYAMTLALPGRIVGKLYGRFPTGLPGKPVLYLAHCEVEVTDAYCPPLPTRIEGRVFFPTGRWWGWFNNVDLDLLLREDGKIHEIGEVWVFEPFYDFRDYAQTIFDHRQSTTDEFQRIVDKYLLNSLYGKLAESSYKEAMLIDPPPCTDCGYVDCRCRGAPLMRDLMPGVWLRESKVPIAHAHVPVSSHCVSIARKTLFDYMTPNSEFYYCDTDGFGTPDAMDTSKKLGGLKLEKRVRKGYFAAAKLYDLELEDGKHLVRGKGYSRLNVSRFYRLVEGEEITFERMRRLRELYREGVSAPEEKRVKKRLRLLETVPKRMTYPDGSTRAWHIHELMSILPKRK